VYHWFNVGIMKDTWNVYDWGKNLVNDRFRLISNLLLLFIILFLGFQNVYGDFTREGFLYAYPVSILVFAFPIYLNIYWLVPYIFSLSILSTYSCPNHIFYHRHKQ